MASYDHTFGLSVGLLVLNRGPGLHELSDLMFVESALAQDGDGVLAERRHGAHRRLDVGERRRRQKSVDRARSARSMTSTKEVRQPWSL
ncbi:hypothetical protein [Streptomyces sp. NPDC003247]|uniref:hypothetical protein n=1 Tax=Streptomyces sp. NPDC003247 TaxID=3364677 RepID=UPI0036CA6194